VVRSTDADDASVVCEGARDAISFLVSRGLDLPPRIHVDVVSRLPADVGPEAAGFFREREQRVFVLTYPQFASRGDWFNVAIDETMYRSLVSHEVAHAVAAYNFRVPKPTIQAKEYVAYVTMLATMAPVQRERVLREFPGAGFEGEWQMNTVVYLVDPMRFGVRAYRHFLQQARGEEFLRNVLDGKVLQENEQPD
jgi:hypothetical protein